MKIELQFSNPNQREFFYARERKQVFSGAFNNGKTYGACLKALVLLLTFANYRIAFGRQTYKDLKITTMETFFKICPPEMVESHNQQDGLTVLKNGSTIYWLHLDNIDENTLRGLEINTFIGDQAEEFDEKVYLVLLARVGRWDNAIVPPQLLDRYSNWPRNSITNKPLAPSYMILLCNPADTFHFIYRKYHPESIDRELETFFIESEWDQALGSAEAYADAVKNDPEWVLKYVRGKWGISSAAIHFLPPSSILAPSEFLLRRIREKGNLFRTLDHGDSAPTCCLWWAAIEGVYICFREYYVPNRVISYHRQAIAELSRGEEYENSWADPAIFKKTAQNFGGRWTVADEYKNSECSAPVLYLNPADNNEFATRNRINELLQPSNNYVHPITREREAVGIYFIKRSDEYPYGCSEAPRQLIAQKRLVLGSFNGKILYSDDRDEKVVDHAYDCIRYFVGQVGTQPERQQRAPGRFSFAYYNAVKDYLKNQNSIPMSVR
jgi:hypothetical protein